MVRYVWELIKMVGPLWIPILSCVALVSLLLKWSADDMAEDAAKLVM